jgi:hypothetical protein
MVITHIHTLACLAGIPRMDRMREECARQATSIHTAEETPLASYQPATSVSVVQRCGGSVLHGPSQLLQQHIYKSSAAIPELSKGYHSSREFRQIQARGSGSMATHAWFPALPFFAMAPSFSDQSSSPAPDASGNESYKFARTLLRT